MKSTGRMLCFLLLGLALAGCAADWTPPPDGPRDRFISLRHSASKELVEVRYIQNGRYDRDALRRLDHIFRDRRTGATTRIDPRLIDFIADLRDRVGLPDSVSFELLSGYRTPESNALLAKTNGQVARESWHMKGRAVDLRVPHLTGKAMAEVAKTMQRGGVAWYPKTGHVHIDLGEVRSWAPK